jgi:mRNA interferase MazF
MKRGEIWWATLPPPAGSGPGLRRPVLVVQAKPFNQSRIPTVVVVTVTSNLALADAPGNVRVGRSDSGLSKPSVINVSQVMTVDRDLLTERVRALPASTLHRVEDGLRLVLAL